MWNFLTHEWEQVDGKSIHTGNIEAVATKEKSKFPQHFFPEVRSSCFILFELNCHLNFDFSIFLGFSANGHEKVFYVHDGKLLELLLI